MALELGTHPKLTQIADALVYVGGYPHCRAAYGSFWSRGRELRSKAPKSISMLTLCLPEGNMSKEAQQSEPLRH